MAPIRPSAAGSQSGFTLTELLVVLAIIGLLTAAVPVLLQSAMPGARSLAAARTLAGDLRAARGRAIARGGATVMRFDVARQTYVVDPDHRAHSLPGAIPFTLQGTAKQIEFYADGSSTGGVVFVGEGSLRHRVATDWLTGRVTVDE